MNTITTVLKIVFQYVEMKYVKEKKELLAVHSGVQMTVHRPVGIIIVRIESVLD
jgi:thioester reductase-like protein